ncbi:MAG: phosphoribosylanthranilate isomerase [Proteobacteria bacterium]|nr:phosphoribosylanthranilate isomerase [Pseudomonadota bacterium]
MTPVQVKICGITDPESLATAAEAGADWVGFVFFPPSPRALQPARAAALSAGLVGGPGRVGLFVDPTDAEVAVVLDALPLDALQVYATAERVAALRARFDRPVWRAIGVATASDLPAEAADRLVLEARPPATATRPGGNAIGFDWSVLRGWRAPVPWLLAGGLTPLTVAAAIRATGAPGVDVSSGVERAPGVKDPALIRAFVAAAHAACVSVAAPPSAVGAPASPAR